MNQTALLSSIAEKITLLKHELLKKIKKGFKKNFQDSCVFWQPTLFKKQREVQNEKTPTLSLLVIYNDFTEISNASVQLFSITLDNK